VTCEFTKTRLKREIHANLQQYSRRRISGHRPFATQQNSLNLAVHELRSFLVHAHGKWEIRGNEFLDFVVRDDEEGGCVRDYLDVDVGWPQVEES
jgi:hypothetical protein